MSVSNLINKIRNVGLIQFGDFVLKSGKKSNVYFDFRRLISYPELLKETCYELGKLIDADEKTIVAGVPMGAIPFASSISTIHNIPMIMIREQRKSYGMKNLIEGDFEGKECVLIEDVVTTGGSVIKTVKNVEQEGLKIKEIIIILDRQDGGIDNVKELGYTVKSLFKMEDLLKTDNVACLKHNKIINRIMDIANNKESNLILSADLENPQGILNLAESVGPYVLGVKLHLDIVNFDQIDYKTFSERMLDLKQKHNFIVLEDRKYSDIGNTVLKQYNKISNLVDVVTAYSISGKSMVKTLDQAGVGLLLIHKLSTKDSLIDSIYSKKTEDIADECDNFVGFVSQEKVDGKYLVFSPGVNIEAKDDNKGQKYNTPETLSKRGTDFFIVGRGIYQNADPVKAALEYKKRCWKCFSYKVAKE